MPRDAAGRFSEVDDERRPLELRRLITPDVLRSVSAEGLSELVRAALILGSLLVAVVVWQGKGWSAERPVWWAAGVDRLAVQWGASVLRGRPTSAMLRQASVGPQTREMMGVFGLLGGLFGLLGGVGGGLVARSFRRASKAGVAGFGFGAAASSGLCLLVVPVYLGLILRSPDGRIAIAAHAAINSGAAAACGLAVGLASRVGRGGSLRLTAAGVLGACLGALLFGLVEISFFPFESELALIPRTSLCRFFEYVCATIVPALCIAVILQAPPVVASDGEEEARG